MVLAVFGHVLRPISEPLPAQELYQEALELESGCETAELLHLLGALKVQRLVVDEDAAAGPEIAGAVELLRRALRALPEAAEAERARVMCSLGTALLHAPEWPGTGATGSKPPEAQGARPGALQGPRAFGGDGAVEKRLSVERSLGGLVQRCPGAEPLAAGTSVSRSSWET